MKSPKTILTFLILFAAVQLCYGQEKQKPILIDQFGKIYCDEFLGRLDNFLIDLQNDPNSTGYAVIYTRENLSQRSLAYLNVMGGHIEYRRFDRGRVSIIRAKKDTEFEIEVWRIPPGAEKPQLDEWSNVLPASTKAFVFTATCCDAICPTHSLRLCRSLKRQSGREGLFGCV